MSKEFSRSERISEGIQKALSKLVIDNIRDPRIGMVSINYVEVSKDYAVAKVYVSFIDLLDSEAISSAVDALNGAASYLRKMLSSELGLWSTPKLRFLIDKVGKRASQISDLIDQALAADAAVNGGASLKLDNDENKKR